MWAGRIAARHVVILSHQLLLNQHSRCFAIKGGTPELKGWDASTQIEARTHNLIASLLMGLSGGKSQPGLFIDYPKPPVAEVEQPKTLAEFSVAGFNRFMYGEG